MTWFLIGTLTVGCYFFKASGVLAAGNLRLSSNGESALSYLTPAVLSGLIMVQTFDGGYAIAGSTKNYGNGTKLDSDVWLVKTDSTGFSRSFEE